MYEDLVKRLRYAASYDERLVIEDCKEAADAIEELLKAAKAMHTWIFLNSADEQAAYDECGLSDEMNAVLGYGGQFVLEPPKGCEDCKYWDGERCANSNGKDCHNSILWWPKER